MFADVTNSITGPVSGQYWPSATTGHIITLTAGGTKGAWISAPLSAGVTISGTITPNLWGLESNANCNCGARYEVLRWSVATGGIVSSLGISTDGGVTEWATSVAVRTSPTLTPTSTAFLAGDRIVIIIYNDDGNGVTEGSGRTWRFDYHGATPGADGDTYLGFTESISFSADSNNARPLAVTSRVRGLTDFPLLPFYFDQWRIRQLTDSEPGNLPATSRSEVIMSNVDVAKIHQGPGKLWLGVSAPASDSRLLISAAGEPTDGSPVFAGATEGATTVVLSPKLEQISADQVAGPIDVVMTGEAASIEVTMKESDLAKLKYFVVHGNFSTGTDTGLPEGAQAYEEISFGGVMAIPKTSVAVISARRDAADKHVVSQLYQAYQAEAIQLPFQRGKETTYKVKFEGLADPARAAGDQMGKIYRQT